MPKPAVTICFADVKKAYDAGDSWRKMTLAFFGKYTDAGSAALQRCWNAKKDVEWKPRGPNKTKKANGHNVDLLNEQLQASNRITARIQAKVRPLLDELRRSGVSRLVIDVDTGEATGFGPPQQLFHVKGEGR